jgi:hypothetical protein
MLTKLITPSRRMIIPCSVNTNTVKWIGSSVLYNYYNSAVLTQSPEYLPIMASQNTVAMVLVLLEYREKVKTTLNKKFELPILIAALANWLSQYFSITTTKLTSIFLEPIVTTSLLTLQSFYSGLLMVSLLPFTTSAQIISILNYIKIYFFYKLLKNYNPKDLFFYMTLGNFLISLPIITTTSYLTTINQDTQIFLFISSIFYYLHSKLTFDIFNFYLPSDFTFMNSFNKSFYILSFLVITMFMKAC